MDEGRQRGRGDRGRRLDPATQVRLLLEISRRTRGTLELEEILQHLLDTLREVVAYDAAGIFVLRGDVDAPFGRRGALIAGMAERGFDRGPGASDPMLDLGRGVIGHVIRSGRPALVPDVRREPRYIAGRARTASEAAVPVLLDGRTVGALNVESDVLAAYDAADLETLGFFAEAAAIAIEKAMLHRRLLAMREMEGQLRLAQEVQARLLPPAPPPLAGYDLAGTSLPASEIGGDYFDFLPLPGGTLGLAIADVAGKGIPAALVMATYRALLRTALADGASPALASARVNRLLHESSWQRVFVTGFHGVLAPASGHLAYANCGHPPPLLLRAGGAAETLAPSGPLLGVFPEAEFGVLQATLRPGDTLVLYTDGVVEALDAREEQFGTARLAAAVRATAGAAASDALAAVLAAARAHAGRDDLEDDFTLVLVRRLGA